jgi:hypothetical protein
MSLLKRLAVAAAPFALVLLVCGFKGEVAPDSDVSFVVTATPQYEALAGLRGAERFPQGAQLLAVRNGHPEPLTSEFAATADASVSFDGKTVLFAGKKTAGDKWQVWEITLANHAVRKVIGGDSDVVRPLYLPGGRLVYARHTEHGFQLEVAQLDGTGALPLSYMHGSALPADVLADGRILFEANFPLGSDATQVQSPEMFLVYSDGSGVESYRCDHGAARWGGRQLASGDVVFTHGAGLARFTSPLAHEARISAPAAQYAGGIVELPSGAWLASARAGASKHFTLAQWKPGSVTLKNVFAQNGQDLVQPALVAPRATPKRHPSALHDWDYANLLALDARQTRDGRVQTAPAHVRLETIDRNGHAVSMGAAEVETDGSYFVKVPADQPIRFVLLDEKGAVVKQEQGWFWIRRGEQRICVGCHVGPEHASENRVPAVLLKTTVATDLTLPTKTDAAPKSMAGGR